MNPKKDVSLKIRHPKAPLWAAQFTVKVLTWMIITCPPIKIYNFGDKTISLSTSPAPIQSQWIPECDHCRRRMERTRPLPLRRCELSSCAKQRGHSCSPKIALEMAATQFDIYMEKRRLFKTFTADRCGFFIECLWAYCSCYKPQLLGIISGYFRPTFMFDQKKAFHMPVTENREALEISLFTWRTIGPWLYKPVKHPFKSKSPVLSSLASCESLQM